MGLFHDQGRFPHAPKTPLFVCYMSLVEKIPADYIVNGTMEHTPVVGEVFAFIPYLDLPHYALDEERAIAFITFNGKRGWLSKDEVDTFFEDRNRNLIDSPTPNMVYESFEKMFADAGWETTIHLWDDINWEQHFRKRTDDGDIDLIPIEWFREFPFVEVCGYCGHVNPKRYVGFYNQYNHKCEACNFDPKEHETLVESKIEDKKTFSEQFSDEWS